VGLTPEQIVEALLQSSGYCGFPRALNATAVAKRVFQDRGLLPLGGQVA
jgi:4-carboxymuconolactone decarboxylase